jgi:hypothetical protein
MSIVNTVKKLCGSINVKEFLDQLGDCLLLKKGSAPWKWVIV